MKNAGEARRPIRRFYEKGRSAAASPNQYTAEFLAISCKPMKVKLIRVVTGLARFGEKRTAFFITNPAEAAEPNSIQRLGR
jgi:hypothetical protein